MCASSYDYCSPTFTGACGEDCAAFVRAGSILSAPGGCPPLPSEGYVDQPVVEEAEIARIEVDQQNASPIIVSVADAEVEPTSDDGPTLPVEEGPALAVEKHAPPTVENGPSLVVEKTPAPSIDRDERPSDGWKVAKRPAETDPQ
jgi:hypothetical protein